MYFAPVLNATSPIKPKKFVPANFGKGTDNLQFIKTLKARVNDYFKEKGISRNANGWMIAKTVFLVTSWVGLYLTILFSGFHPLILLGLATLFGLWTVIMVINIAHDASHKAYSKSPLVNRILSFSWNLIGFCEYTWELKHNFSHHGFTNIVGVDIDLQQSVVLRYNPSQKRLWFHRFQHFYAPILYCLAPFMMIFVRDLKLFSMKRFGNRYIDKHPVKEWIVLILTKVWYVCLMIVIPYLVMDLPFWQIFVGFLAMQSLGGLFIALVNAPPHVTRNTQFVKPDPKGDIEEDWLTNQLNTTVDFNATNPLMVALTGGLNAHVAHHLFPNICHIHYRPISKIVKETADEFGVRYQNYSWPVAIYHHFVYLKELGRVDVPKL